MTLFGTIKETLKMADIAARASYCGNHSGGDSVDLASSVRYKLALTSYLLASLTEKKVAQDVIN